MPQPRPTLKEIYTRIKADMEVRVSEGVAIPSRSLLGILATVFAGAMYLAYGFLNWISKQIFPDTMDIDSLEREAKLLGIPRKSATFATGTIIFTGTDAVVVPAGTEVQDSAGSVYETDSEVTISGGVALANITAQIAGVAYNSTDATVSLVSAIVGVDSEASVSVAPNGGNDQETAAALAYRIGQRWQNPPSSGKASDYVRWALEVAGVGRAWVLNGEEYAGWGTVGVVIATEELAAVSPAVKTAVVDYIESVRPNGAFVGVLDITPVVIDFTINIYPNTAQTRQSVTTKLSALFRKEAAANSILPLSRIESTVSASGIYDRKIVTILRDAVSVPVADISTTTTEVPVLGTITFGDI